MAVRPVDGEELLGITRLLDTDVVRQSKTASWLLDQVLHDIQAMPTLPPPNEPRMINADKLAKRIAGHSNYHGDSILAAIYCAAESKESDIPIQPIETPPNEWVSVEKALPPEHETVLCIVSGKPKPNITLEDAYQLGSWNKADGWIIDEWLDWEGANVTWWMKLPAPPDKDNNVPAKTPNEPLTLEQLREMDGEPVWVKCLKPDKYTCPPVGWRILELSFTGKFGVWNGDCALIERDYGTDWLAYRRPKEGEEDT